MVGDTILSTFSCVSMRVWLSHLQTPYLNSCLTLKYLLATLASLLFLQLNWQVLSSQNTHPYHQPQPQYLHDAPSPASRICTDVTISLTLPLTTLFKIATASAPSSLNFPYPVLLCFPCHLPPSNILDNLLNHYAYYLLFVSIIKMSASRGQRFLSVLIIAIFQMPRTMPIIQQ